MFSSVIGMLIIGGVAGWIAGQIMRGGGFGVFGNIGVGIVGSLVGGFVFGALGLRTTGLIGTLVAATAGAVGEEVEAVARVLCEMRRFKLDEARRVLDELRCSAAE